MIGKGTSYGAITVINAMPCGIGSTIGVSLRTSAVFTLAGDTKNVGISNDPSEDKEMAKICVSETYKKIGVEEPKGWGLKISSDIPISRGLKSSSSACNAIVSSVLDSERADMDVIERIRLGVNCARMAKVTVTGSFDDACGCGLGGHVITDNRSDTILFHGDIDEYDVVLYVPREKIRKTGLPLDRLKSISSEIEKLIGIAKTDPFKAMTMNGKLIASVSGLDNSISDIAMESGALGAGVSGSGPAVAIVLEKGDTEDFIRRSGLIGLKTTITRRKQI
ncbi:MAG: shikimate kinase [Candidatus Methanoplasma sp.]|jgi:shikimate kinase|nr:shikimate kinase [Candidatus Methanoplasma sp.]